MEDEDGESRILDMWNILEEQRLKDSTLSNVLRHSIDDIYTDVIEEEKQLIRYNSIITKESSGRNTVGNPKLTFKGFKKRILAQARDTHTASPKNSTSETQQSTHPNARANKDKRTEGKRERKITEYAQYLGLQPSARYKCSKCHTWSLYGPNTKQNSCACNSSMTPMPSTSESSTSMSHSASSFKITRKVYLCAACGTYFENWNLFLHMRDIHKRHICLYCLGMFGQAERLSYHLMKKHSVPEMAFTSVEDFYNAFKGSCYLVCCSCERVFSETDDFFHHYCSLVLKQDATDTGSSVCTICRQSAGTHATTCSFASSSDADRDLYSSATPLSADATHADNASPAAILPPGEKTTNLGGKGPPRKATKHKSKHSGGDAQNSRQQKSTASTRKLGANTRCNESQLDRSLDTQREITNNLPRDTVTETIMEVSRYTGGDSSDENDENDEQTMNKDVCNNHDKESREPSPVQNYQLDRNEPYDSVTETIMEVSRYTGEEDQSEKEKDSTCITDECTSRTIDEKMSIENNETCDKSGDVNLVRSSDSKPPSPVQWEAEETAMADAKANATCEPEIESECRSYGSPQNVQSPVARSLFSPQHESHALDPKEREHVEDVEKDVEEKPVATCTAESQASFNTVASSDRSLIIKICNRNSQFTVATTTTSSKKSEENNNAQGSTSRDKMLNGSQMERDVNEDDEANNELDDSDSDSDKLAVVDSNPEEDEEAEDGEEAEEADEVEEPEDRDRCNDARDDENHKNREENDGITIETSTDRDTFAIASMPDDVSIEKFVNNEVEDAAEGVASDQPKKSDTTGIDGAIALAGEDAPCIDLNVEGTLDSMDLEELLKRCIEAASPICVYCNHARHIAINGKQLGLHMLAEHKFQPQHPAIIIQMEQFTTRVRRSLDELESRYFNLNTYTSANGTYNVPAMLIYECFHCRFHSAIHKELYLHNRKMHQKTILICIMCKSTFYSYSELLCHLCPGIYSPNVNLRYRCCLCSVVSLPSAFRLMVHLRKRHHVCDVCLESTGNQQRLSNHVWKHKLHHLCYRCGIAYRNKPDITKHLFWKHGTESVLCRKCLQKKWPHIYHFCIPPTAFVCEECGLSFGRAVALKVHKRLHSGDSPYGCDECTERFISRKLLAKHQATHRESKAENIDVNTMDVVCAPTVERDEKTDTTAATIDGGAVTTGATGVDTTRSIKEAVKKVVDVYDLPPLNLSSESDTDSEEQKITSAEKLLEKEKVTEETTEKKSEIAEELFTAAAADDAAALNNDIVEMERNEEEKKQEARIMDDIWDNFKTYAASLDVEESAKNIALKESVPETDAAYLRSIIFADHDYFVVYSDKEKSEDQAIAKVDDIKDERDGVKSKRSPSPGTPNHNAGCDSDANKRKIKTSKKKKRSDSTSSTSDSSSDSDTSSSNCSCTSSSSGSSSSSSSSSDSDSSTSESSPRKQSSNRKEKHKKEKEVVTEDKLQSVELESKPEIIIEKDVVVAELTSELPTIAAKPLLRESDLETEETETDEDFYDEHPQLLANKLLSEKRNQLLLLAAVAPASTSVPALAPVMEQPSTPLNNGILGTEQAEPELIMISEDHRQPQQQQQKRKIKTKKRRKGERGAKRNATAMESIKLNIPKAYYRKNPGFVASSPAMLPNSKSSTPNQLSAVPYNDHHGGVDVAMEVMQQQQQQQTSSVIGVPSQRIGAGGMETENKRVSKRKRVPKRFYGDSSDDEDKQPAFNKWRKTSASPSTFASPPPPPTAMTSPNLKPIVPRYSLGGKTGTQTYTGNRSQVIQMEQTVSQQQAVLSEALPRITPTSVTESDDPAESSSDSSESETEDSQARIRRNNLTMPPTINASAAERPGKIYCYCRCPYDEVSEMIACDGEDCRIEWFHFECVGIMVPPKGKWYCPDCRKKHGIVQNNDEYCD